VETQLPRRDKSRILAICCFSLFIVGLDVTVVNVALPTIGRELHSGLSGLQWTIDAYTVVLASLLMLGGSLGDRLGRKRVFITGLSVFSLASLLCSLAPTTGLLIAFRALQAVGGSMLNPVAMGIVTNTFTQPRERAQAVGLWGSVFGVSLALGPVVGGALVSAIGWRPIFWINVPVGLAAILLTIRFIPDSRAPRPRRFDPVGQLLVMVLLGALTYGIIEAPGSGWTSPEILAAFAASGAALLGLLLYEPRRKEPLIDLRFFRSIPFTSAVVIAVAAFAAFGGFLFLNTLYLQEARGLSPVQAGLLTVPVALMIMVASPLSGRIVGRRGPRLPLVLAGVGLLIACILLAGIGPATPLVGLLAIYVVFGLGFGLVNAPITNTAVSGMPREQAGVAAAIATTSRQVGQVLGVAVVGALAGTHAGTSAHASWWTLAGCGAVILLLGFFATTRRATESAERTAAMAIG
jgi:EmrB/QacA subfamily drug resistance transporter